MFMIDVMKPEADRLRAGEAIDVKVNGKEVKMRLKDGALDYGEGPASIITAEDFGEGVSFYCNSPGQTDCVVLTPEIKDDGSVGMVETIRQE